MDQKTLLEALTTVWTVVPDDARFHVPVANQQCDIRLLIRSLLNHGYSPNSIADDLWYDLIIRNNRVKILSKFFVANDVSSLLDIKSSSGTISPADGATWHCAALRFTQSDGLWTTILYWATNILEDMLIPMKRGGGIPASAHSGFSSDRSPSSRDSHIKPRILARDGVISPVSQAIDESAPLDIMRSNRSRVTRLYAAHIIPFMVSKYTRMQRLLSMFAGSTNLQSKLRGTSINSPSNMFCADDYNHLLFDEFAIGIEKINGKYWLRKLDMERAANGIIGDRADGDEIVFGKGPQGNHIALPDRELLNIHLAIGRVLHASGAGEVISKILRDEEDYNEGNVKDASSAARISALALNLELKRLQDEESENNKLQERGPDILRVTTNSQIGS
ncbi:hypothetical protein V1527DRAFT_455392 [Lipomyces starkeyi]